MRSLLLLAALPASLVAQSPAPGIDEWEVPYAASRPRDPYVAPDGRIWFVGQVGNYLAVLDPKSGAFERVEIDEGTNPHNLIVDNAGTVWYAGNRNGMIGRYDPATRQITRYPMPDAAVRDPHTLAFDQQGTIWFTAQQAGYVGRLVPTTGKIDLIKVPGERTRPYGIVVDAKGRPFFDVFGTNKLAMIDPATKRVQEWPSPSGGLSLPYAMTSDDLGRLWWVETGPRPNRLIAFDPALGKVVVNEPVGTDAPNTIRHMVYHAPTRSIWYGSDANMIGRVKVPPRTALLP